MDIAGMTTDFMTDHVSGLLLRHRVFPLADDDLVHELATICSLLSVPGGTSIVSEGEQPDAVYIIVSGIFGAYRRTRDGEDLLLNRMGVGEIVGELGFITGNVRTASVKALRNSELLRIARDDLQALASRRPSILFTLCATVIRRLQQAQASPNPLSRARCFCLLPAHATIDMKPFVQDIVRSLEKFGTLAIVAKDQAEGQTSGWFTELEQRFDYVFFQGDVKANAWTRLCLRQSDGILLLARGEAEAVDFAALGPGRIHVPKGIPLDLVLLWQNGIVSSKTRAWLDVVKPRTHFHVRKAGDAARALRLITGRGTGLVLSGGGARGLAHVGVLDALSEHGIAVDVIGGTSIGAVVAAAFALEWNLSDMAKTFAREFSRPRLTDYAIPRIAMFSERIFERTLGRGFGAQRIEDAPIPFFCVSTNLTHGRESLHKAGLFLTWLRAATAIPGVFPPVVEDNVVYVDGGVLNNMPANGLGGFGVGPVIAVDIGSDSVGPWRFGDERRAAKKPEKRRLPSMAETLWRVGSIGSGAAEEAARRDCDLILRPAVGTIGLFGWRAREQAIEAGRMAVVDNLDAIRAVIARAEE